MALVFTKSAQPPFAVIQRWAFKDGKVTYQSSILDSDDYKKSAKLNGMGFGKTFQDPCKSLGERGSRESS
ncbi:beta-carotene 9, 10-dioxygenase 2-like [Plakobranchus ocellatus]|uniref:Beta-carotene 9, 10-dioxygenase 2-like n=1 Tax=Plakobranchus ocellatus TaxID=259542 RepID=A0AAV3YUT6_9GAST|nr:beta-carotene 9, 10-dioxygenase 2-like [Plakobranchus ocellatus]